MSGNTKLLMMETYRVLTALIMDPSETPCEELVEGLHQSIALELATAYMLDHGYGIDINKNFIEKQETRF